MKVNWIIRNCMMWVFVLCLIQPTPLNAQIKTKNKKSKFYESITVSGPVDHTAQITPILELFDLPQFNCDSYLNELEKLNILKKDGQNYWFLIPLQEDFGNTTCYMVYDSTLFWFGGFKLFAWSKDGKDKKEPEVIVWAEYIIKPDVGIVQSNSDILDNTGYTHIDMKDFYSNLKGAHLEFKDRKKPKVKK